MKWRTIYHAQWDGDSTVWKGDCPHWAESLRKAGCNVTSVRALVMGGRAFCAACTHGLIH